MHLNREKNHEKLHLIFENVAYTIVLYLYFPFVQMFAKRIGAEDIHIALLTSGPALVAIFVLIPCGVLIERIDNKRKTVMMMLFINSLFYAAITFVPSLPGQIRVTAYIILIGLMNWPASLYLSTIQSYLADHFQGTHVNRIVSQRNKYGTLFGLFTALITGWLLTVIPRSDEERLFVYQIFYSACFLLTLLEIYLFYRIDIRPDLSKKSYPATGERPRHTEEPNCSNTLSTTPVTNNKSFVLNSSVLKGIAANKPYIFFCLCGFVFYLAWQMGWPLIFIYNTTYIGLNEFQLGLLSLVTGFAQFITMSVWNKLIDKKGCRLVIIFGAVGIAINPFFFTVQQSFAVVLLVYIVLGASTGGFLLSVYCGLLEVLPARQKTVYVSIFNTFTNISGFLSPLIGVWLYKHTDIYLSLGIIGFFRLAAVLLYIVRWRLDRNSEDARRL